MKKLLWAILPLTMLAMVACGGNDEPVFPDDPDREEPKPEPEPEPEPEPSLPLRAISSTRVRQCRLQTT